MQGNLHLSSEPLSEMGSFHTSHRPSSLHRRTSKLGNRTVLYIPFKERMCIGLAVTTQVIVIALLIAAVLTDVFQVDGTRATQNGVDLTDVSAGLGVSVTESSKPFCYSLWGARKCGTAAFHTQGWYTAHGMVLKGFPSLVSYNMMKGSSAFAVLAVCYSFINLVAIGIVVCMQNYMAVLCAWSFSTWTTILISWALTVGVYNRSMGTIKSTTMVGRQVHMKDYCSFSLSFVLTMIAFFLHAFQFTFTVVYTRMYESRMKSLVTEQKHFSKKLAPAANDSCEAPQ
ncbi:hypothetical protein JKF63_06694 [Porcisia hertigi]|uniref:Uncharacterized protein n=1 Tax=Porcisia hertigi TaxID=2761500 RepID=A0A836IC67_9TRYP|nr:hypothetical protein JKF63_06694 [Porcisia hertigi]